MSPSCCFLPSSAEDVQQAIRILTDHDTSFAIASGGHSSVTGASNIEDGITIDLSALNAIEVIDGETTNEAGVWLGPGARWDEVYAALEPHGLTVSGGRVSDVGVGGYVLGGGFSWFANERGWTCDDVLAFEVVTPSAQVLVISGKSHGDLFWALKGALGALGVVTRIMVPALRDRLVYGGALSYDPEYLDEVFSELAASASGHSVDADLGTQAYLSLGWIGRSSSNKAFGNAVYMVNTVGDNSSIMISGFKDIPHIGSTLRNMSIRKSAHEITESNTRGLRRSKFTFTTVCGQTAMRVVYEACHGAVGDLQLGAGEMVGVTLQPLTMQHLQHQTNIFNLSPEDGPLLLISVEAWWKHADDDTYFEEQMCRLHNTVRDMLDDHGMRRPFIYPNYATKWQDPFVSLQASAKARLGLVRRRYDPDDVWRTLVPGLWHI